MKGMEDLSRRALVGGQSRWKKETVLEVWSEKSLDAVEIHGSIRHPFLFLVEVNVLVFVKYINKGNFFFS